MREREKLKARNSRKKEKKPSEKFIRKKDSIEQERESEREKREKNSRR